MIEYGIFQNLLGSLAAHGNYAEFLIRNSQLIQ